MIYWLDLRMTVGSEPMTVRDVRTEAEPLLCVNNVERVHPLSHMTNLSRYDLLAKSTNDRRIRANDSSRRPNYYYQEDNNVRYKYSFIFHNYDVGLHNSENYSIEGFFSGGKFILTNRKPFYSVCLFYNMSPHFLSSSYISCQS